MAKDKKKRSANYIGAADELVRKAKADPEGTAASVSEWESSQREQAIQDRAAREIAAKNLRSYIQRHPSFSRSQKDAIAAAILRETTDINAAHRRENIGKAQREIQSQNELTSNPYAQAMRKTMLNQERARLDSLPGFSVSELDALDDDERNRRITDWAKRSAAVDRGLEKTNQSIDAYNAAKARQRNDTEQEELNKYINNPTAMVARMTMLNQERARLDSLPSMTLDEAMDYGSRSAAVNQGLRQTERNLSDYDKAMERLKLQQYGDTVRENADFTEYSRKGASAENPDNQWQAVWTGNRVKNPVTYARAQAEKPKNAFARFMDNAFNYGQSDSPGDIQRLASYMTRDEVNVYNYLWAKDQENGTSDASKYFTDLTKTLFERQSEGYVEGAQKWSTESAGNSALASGTTVLRSPANGVAYLDALATKAQGKRIDPSSATQVQARVNSSVRGAVANEISDTVSSGTGSQFLGDATSFLYQTGLSIADSALNTAITGGNALASSALMGGTAATSAMQEALDGGASDTQALAVGGLAGFFEAFFERFSIENFLKMSSPAAKGSAIMNLLRQMGIEASEELGTEVADIVSEYLVMRDISQYKDATPGEIAQQIALAALGGALSGGVMGGTGLLVNNIQSNQIGKAASRVGVSDSVIQDALNSNDPSARALAQQMLDGEAKTNSRNVGKLYASLAENGDYSNYDTEAILRAAAEEAAAEKQQKKSSKTAQRQTASQNAQNAPESVSSQEQTNRTNTEENAQQTRKQPRVDYATNVVDNEETDITGIHSVEDGTVYVQAGDNVVALNDVEFANADIGELYERAGKYGTEAAQRFVKAYDGGSVEQYAKGFDAMYRAARDGVAYDTALQQSLYVENYLSEDQRMQAYAAGQSTSAQAQTQVATNQEQAATEQQVEKPQNTEVSAAVQTESKAAQQVKKAVKPGLTRSYVRAELTNEQRSAIKKNRSQLQVVDAMAKKYGREVVLVGSLQGMEINGQTVEQSANGVYDPSSGRIYIAADAQDGAFAYVAMHELAHSVRAASESDYNALQTTVFDALTKDGQNVDDLVKYQMDTFGYSEDVAREEVVANSAATVLTDEEFVRNLYNNEHSLFEQIRKFFKELADTFKQLTQSASWSQDAALTPENVRAIAEVFDRVAADTAATANEEGTVVKLSKKSPGALSVKEQISSHVDQLDQMKPVASTDIHSRPQRNGYPDKTLMREKLNEHYGSQRFTVDRKGFGQVQFDQNALREMVGYINSDSEFVAAMEAPAIVKRGIEIDHHVEHKGHDDVESFTFAAPIAINEVVGYAAVVVQRTNRNKPHCVRILSPDGSGFDFGQKKKVGQTSSAVPTQGDKQQRIGSTFKNSVAEASDVVKFSAKDPVEKKGTLLAIHNLTEEKLQKFLALGGAPMPSIAVTRSDVEHSNFGDISLIFDKSTIDPKASRKNTVYSADAWTPTFPQIEYETNTKVDNAVYSRLTALSRNMDEFYREDLKRVLYGVDDGLNRYGGEAGFVEHAMDNLGLQAAYLEDNGEHIDRITKQVERDKGYSEDRVERYQKVAEVLGTTDADEIGKMPLNEIRDQHGAELEKAVPGITKSALRLSGVLKQTMNYLRNAQNGTQYDTVTDYDAMRSEVEKRIDKPAFEKWVKELYAGIEAGSGVYNGKSLYTPSGNRRSFAATHYPATLENIAKAMAAQHNGDTKNVSGFNGIKTLRAGMAQRFKSIADMHALEGRLQNRTQEQADALNNALSDRMYDLMHQIDATRDKRYASMDNSLMAMDNVGEIMMEIADGGKYSAQHIQDVFNGYGLNIDGKLANDVRTLLFDVQQMPVNLFEAKPERAVYTNEVRMAVMPEGEYPELQQQFRDMGIPVETYDPEVQGDRVRVMNSDVTEPLRFSVKDVEPADAKKLQRENDKLKGALENARAQLRLTDGMQVDEKAVTKLARGIVTDYSSKADVAKLSNDLYQLFNYASHSPDTDAAFSELNDIGIGVARQVIEQSQQVDTSVSEQFSDLKDYLKSTPIRLTDAQKEQIAASYGSLANFRKEYRGTIKISNDGVALDTVIGEMAESYPFLYDSIQGGDLIETLTDAADVTKPQIVNPYYMDMDGAAADLWLEIQQRYTDTPMVQTYADKQKTKLVELKQQQKQQIKELRQQAKDEMDVALQIAKERAQRQQDAAVRGERQKQQVKTEKLKAKNQQLRTDIENERIANAVNRALASKRYAALKKQNTADLKTQRETIKTRERVGRYKDRIKAAAMTLSAWNTSPSDKRFVPEGLRRAVSDFVSAIDMGFKEGSKVSENWKARMRQMQIAVENAQRSSPDVGMATWDQETVDNLASLTALIEGNDNIKSLRDLSEPQLKALADVLNGIKHEVINANKMFVNGRRESLSKAADSDIARMGSQKTGKVRKQLQKFMDSKLMLGNTKPIFLMDSLGGVYERIGRDLFNGRTEAAFILRDSKEFHSDLKERYHVDKWLDQKGDVLTLNTEFGDTIRLSRGQALDVYEMYQREQQDTHTRHLADGGIVFKTDADGKRVDDTTAHPISDADIQKITSWLTDEQIAYADALVRYMSTTLAEAGNKTSLTLSGYKKYTGQHYVPFNSASDYIAHGAGQADGQQTPRLKNWGHGKSINAFANNPVVVESIDQIFGNHAEEMAKYAGLAIPQDNMIRYLNYKQPNEQGKRQMSMKSALRAAYGDNVVRYIDRFNADVGGKITADVRDQEMGVMLSKFKKGAVLASMSVVVQQPTAYFRAFSMMNPKYMRLGWMGAYQEAQQYAGTAIIKDIGGFDMQTSMGAADWILDKKPSGPIEWSDKVFGTLPEKADAVTWGALWNSVKAEIHGETGLAMDSEALLKAAGKRFDEVIDFTQVYDSTFSRSDWMRSKSKFGSMVTAFMAEPTTSMNMFMYSVLHAKDKNYSGKVHVIPATLALAATTIINAAVKAVVYAARDDDDYATFWEKYLAQLKSALFGDKIEGLPDWLGTPLGFVAGSDFSVFTQIPLVSDVMELAQGYDVTRTDMNVVGDVVDAALGLFNEKKTVYTKVKNLIGAVGNLTGLPVKNLWRDVESVVRLFGVEIPAATGGTADGYAKLYETIASGDEKRAGELRDTLEGKGKSSKDIDTGVAKSLMENDERIRQAYEMKDEGDIAGLEELRAELAETYGEEVVDKAIKLYENSLNSELKKKAEALLESESRIAELYDYSEKGETPDAAKEEALREQLEKQYGKELVEKALFVYSEQFAELDSALYTADDMELVGTLAFESGKTADLKTVVAEMEKDSKATDPKKSVLNKAVTAFKPLYTEALDKGYAQKAARIKKVLLDVYGSYGLTEEKIDKWLPGEKADALYEAVDAGASVQSLNKLIKDAKAAGQKDSNIINRISSTYKEKMLEAWQKGDTRTYNQIASLLKNLNLYDSKGKLYYTDERFKDWQMAEKYDDLPEAVRAGDAGAVKQYVANLKKDGYSDGQITQRVSTNVHDELVEAYLKGDMSTYNKLKSMLQSLDLHDKRGNQYYPDSKIAKWIKDAQEKK